MMGKLYVTRYSVGGYHYGAYIAAGDFDNARQLAAQRGLNETIEGEVEFAAIPFRLGNLIAEEKWLEAAHEATFLGFIGLSSGALTPREVLSDTGLVHELLHLALERPDHPDEDPKIVAGNKREHRQLVAKVKLMARDFEYRIPGHDPSYQAPDRGGGTRRRTKMNTLVLA